MPQIQPLRKRPSGSGDRDEANVASLRHQNRLESSGSSSGDGSSGSSGEDLEEIKEVRILRSKDETSASPISRKRRKKDQLRLSIGGSIIPDGFSATSMENAQKVSQDSLWRRKILQWIEYDTNTFVKPFQRMCGIEWTNLKTREHTKAPLLIHWIFSFGASLGNETFYILFLPIMAWSINLMLGRRLCVLWVSLYYIGQLLKDMLKLPRPFCPPAIQLEKHYAEEYGMPSTHSMCAFTFPFYMTILATGWPSSLGDFLQAVVHLVTLNPIPADQDAFTGYQALMWIITVIWCVIMTLSRLYMGVHTLMDLVSGAILGLLVLFFVDYFGDDLDRWFIGGSNVSFWAVALSIGLALLYYSLARPDKWTHAYGDTCIIIAVGILGVFTGSRILLDAPITPGPTFDAVLIGQVFDHRPNNPIHNIDHSAPGYLHIPNTPIPRLTGRKLPMFINYNPMNLPIPLWLLVRAFLGYGLLFLSRAVVKYLMWKLMLKLFPAPPDCQNPQQRYIVEIPVKLMTYGVVGINALYTALVVFEIAGV